METERPIKDCLNLMKRDIRLINLAQNKRASSDTLAELTSVLDRMAEIARSQSVSERERVVFQEAHC